MPAAAVRTAALYVALVVTGASALVYQVAWGRMLRAVFGVGDVAVAAVLGAYFLGLGFGALAGGRLSRRLARPALGYAALELFVGLYALASPSVVPLLRDAYRAVAGDLSFETVSLLRLGLSMVVLLPPTLAMGASMPVALSAASTDQGGVPVRAALAYALNTLGAMAGAAAAGFYLIPAIGLRASVFLAAAGSVAAAALVAGTWRRAAPSAPAAQEPGGAPAAAQVGGGRPGLAAVLVFLGGFVSLGSEVLWTRVLGIVVHGTTQAFASMLTTFLLGIALGSALATRWLSGARRPATSYAWTQAGVAAATAWAMIVISESPRIIALSTGSQDLAPTSTWVLLGVAAATLLPLATCVGATIPIAWRIAAEGNTSLGSAAARVLAANTLGGLAGALLTALVVIPALGVDLSGVLLLGLALLAAAIAARADAGASVARRSLALALPAAAYALVLLWEPNVHLPYLLRAREAAVAAVFEGPGHSSWAEPIVFLREGRNSTVTVQRTGTSSLRLLNDGRPESGLSIVPPGFGEELIAQGTLPALRCSHARRAAVVGLGAGHTVTTLLAGGFRYVEAIELEPAVIEAARMIHRTIGRPFPLDDRRAHIIVDDGRARIGVTRAATYDAVVSQPSHSWLAGSSALYTREFFTDVRRVLGPGGVFVFWVNRFRMDVRHLREVVATAAEVFPWLEAYGTENDLIVVAARDRKRPTRATLESRLAAAPALKEILQARSLWPPLRLAAFAEMDDAGARAFGRGARTITDDRPSLEYELSHLANHRTVELRDLDRALAKSAWVAPALGTDGRTLDAILARIDGAASRPTAVTRLERGLPRMGLSAAERAVAEGAVAEARGDVGAALSAYRRSSDPEALVRRARLLASEGLDDELLATALAIPAAPAALRREGAVAAVRLGRWSDAVALGRTLVGEDPERGRAIVALAAARASGPCVAVPAEVTVLAIRDDPALLWAVGTCAIEAREAAVARTFLAAAGVAARGRAAALLERGVGLGRGGNRRAAVHALEAALRWNPSQGAAATALARLHVSAGRRDAARAVLAAALAAAHGLPRTTEQIIMAASALQIRLEGATTGADRSATSAAGARPAEGTE